MPVIVCCCRSLPTATGTCKVSACSFHRFHISALPIIGAAGKARVDGHPTASTSRPTGHWPARLLRRQPFPSPDYCQGHITCRRAIHHRPRHTPLRSIEYYIPLTERKSSSKERRPSTTEIALEATRLDGSFGRPPRNIQQHRLPKMSRPTANRPQHRRAR